MPRVACATPHRRCSMGTGTAEAQFRETQQFCEILPVIPLERHQIETGCLKTKLVHSTKQVGPPNSLRPLLSGSVSSSKVSTLASPLATSLLLPAAASAGAAGGVAGADCTGCSGAGTGAGAGGAGWASACSGSDLLCTCKGMQMLQLPRAHMHASPCRQLKHVRAHLGRCFTQKSLLDS